MPLNKDKSKSSICWQNLRDTKIFKFPVKHKRIYTKKNYWLDVIEEIQNLSRRDAWESRVKLYDMSTSLPPDLYKKVSKIIPMIPIEEDLFEEGSEKSVDGKPNEDGDKMMLTVRSFHESECTIIQELDKTFRDVEAKSEKRMPMSSSRSGGKKNVNWQAEFICREKTDRIKWQSKIYELDKNVWEKPLFEQAEQLMDTAADRFTKWVSSLGSNQSTTLSKDLLKSLFSVETGAKLLGGIQIEPKEIRAVPDKVAQKWNVPEMSLEMKLERILKEQNELAPEKVRLSAFGSTLPLWLRDWKPPDSNMNITPVFPEDLRTRKVLFRGIAHLRSTNALIEYYKRNEQVERPQYLVDQGYFNKVTVKEKSGEIPLYEMLNLKN